MRHFFLILAIFQLALISLFLVTKPSLAVEYVPNEIIVKYKDNLSPQELTFQVNERQAKKKSFWGRIQVIWNDIHLNFSKQEKPEIHLSRLQGVDDELGIIDKQLMPESSNQIGPNLYLLKTDGSKTVEEIVKTYETLPEVEYAEPNVIYQPLEL